MSPDTNHERDNETSADASLCDGDATARGSGPEGWLGKPWFFLAILTLINVLLALDRNLLSLLAEPIKNEFKLSDSQLGLLLGLAFGVPYGIAGLALSPVIDRVKRARFLALILALWSGATFTTSLAVNYLTLLLARAGLGAAEAGGAPAAISMLADKFPPERRATAIGVYYLGTPLGHVGAALVATLVAAYFDWRTAFLIAGAPGLLLALFIALRLPEPKRGAMDESPETPKSKGDFAALRFVIHDPVAFPFGLGIILSVLSGASFVGFLAPLLQRTHGLDLGQVGLIVTAGSVIAMVSPVAMGFIADRLALAGTHALAAFMALLLAVLVPVTVLTALAPSAGVAIGALLLHHLLQYGTVSPGIAGIATIAPPAIRGGVLAVIAALNMIIGVGLGPILVGLCSDYLQSLPQAIAIVAGGSGLLSAAFYAFAAYRLRRPECHRHGSSRL